MAGGVRHHSGGILGVLSEALRHEGEVRVTLMTMGLPLGDSDVWDVPLRDLRALMTHPPEGSALYRVMGGWTPVEHMMAASLHAEQMALWQNGGGKGSRPRPLDLEVLSRRAHRSAQRPYGRGRSIEEMAARLGM